MTTSYNGWPAIPSSSDPRLAVIEPVPGRKFRVRAGAVGTVFQHLIRDFHDQVEPITEGPVLDDWSYAYRKVTNGSSFSNHSSGTAVDLNADDHPYGTSAARNFTAQQIATINRLLDDKYSVGGKRVVRWLDGHDPMHFEINYMNRGGSPNEVAALAAALEGAAPVPPVPPVPPVQPDQPGAVATRAPRAVEWANPPADLVRITQEIVGVAADGYRGPRTQAATLASQKRLGVQSPDSLFGPRHALAYLMSTGNLYRAKPDADMPAPAVKLVQWIANEPQDGSFGPGLELAVKEMQQWAGLYPDGNVGADTKRKIVR